MPHKPLYTVFVGHYSLEPHYIGRDQKIVLTSGHRTANAAARKLARLISGRTDESKDAHKLIPQGRGAYYMVKDWEAEQSLSLTAFRKLHNLQA